MKFRSNIRNVGNGLQLLAQLRPNTMPLVFFDPQYRALLDKQGYGNEGVKEARRAKLKAMPDKVICEFTASISRVLRPSGHLMLWCDKFTIGSGHHLQWVPLGMEVVDLGAWRKGRMAMGRRLRCITEYLVVLQKTPKRAEGVWHTHTLLDNVTEKVDRKNHPHAKPHHYQVELIKAVTAQGDTVVDPAAGSYSVMKAAHACKRNFLGCDLKAITA